MGFFMAGRGQRGTQEPLEKDHEHGVLLCFLWTEQDSSSTRALRGLLGCTKFDNGKETSPKQHKGPRVGAELWHISEFSF